jgi:hypothetical protein
MNDKQRGLYAKYKPIERLDAPNPKHDGCEYFILDLTHDAIARDAVLLYALLCKADYPELAKDLVSLVKQNE